MPGRIVHAHMDVSDTRRIIEGLRTECRHYVKVLGPILNEDVSVGERIRKWRIGVDPRRRLAREWHQWIRSPDFPGGLRYRGRAP